MTFTKNFFAKLSVVLFLLFSACSKDQENIDDVSDDNSNGNQSVFLDMTIDGREFVKGVEPSVAYDSTKDQVGLSYIKTGGGDSAVTVIFTLGDIIPMSRPFGNGYLMAFEVLSLGKDGAHIPVDGYMTITANDKKRRTVGGSFQFLGYSQANPDFTRISGEFWVKY